MYKKNELKNLIYIQENKPCNEQTIKGLFRSVVEPVFDDNLECLVLLRLEEKSKNSFHGLLKRLEYSKAKVYDFSANPIKKEFENLLVENIWDKTEFVYILSERYAAVLIFDYEISTVENHAEIYILHNSKLLSDFFGIINSNSKLDLTEYPEKWHPDRRDNLVLNNSVRKIVGILNETNQEVLISEVEKATIEKNPQLEEMASSLEFIKCKSNYVSHEIRNQLSICDLYSTIIQKQLPNLVFKNEEAESSIKNALDCIQKSLKVAANSLLDLKSLSNINLERHEISELIETSVGLAKVYSGHKDIQITVEGLKKSGMAVMIDRNQFLAVIINLIKNAIESIDVNGTIKIKGEKCNNDIKISVSNNGKIISEEIQKEIFKEGFTTKATGSGLGLHICKKSLQEQFAQLELKKSDGTSTEFEITIPRIL